MGVAGLVLIIYDFWGDFYFLDSNNDRPLSRRRGARPGKQTGFFPSLLFIAPLHVIPYSKFFFPPMYPNPFLFKNGGRFA